MRYLSSIAFFLLLLVTSSIGQVAGTTSERKFSPLTDVFQVTAPCEFARLDHDQEWSVYKCVDEGRWFLITSAPNERDSQLEAIKSQAAANFRKTEFALGKPVATGPLASKYSFKDHDGNFQNAVTVSTPNRFYIFHALSTSENDSDIERFINSIIISKGSPAADDRKITNPRTIRELVSAPEKPSKNVSRESALTREDPNVGRVFEVTPGQNSPFKLLQKVGASYTGLAVLYGVQGQVVLRVRFLSSAKIGEITTVEKLPFGLTANAVAAARFMVFEPSVKDGKGETTSRPVYYQFTIY